ncbi:metallophosphoesterase family protein [Phenylobacterium kunshanense]|uniref:Metallophosphoesterase n=1 Tax=Phenylobacterium kunshanense TaxID=1445034 RepID=A0A328B8S1_9CAUL|nr:metallophosphoesterase [Phenylobacterium kunshanense]RAK63065.1 metallophosphoesterase [Phenylobacterium kunshanense]
MTAFRLAHLSDLQLPPPPLPFRWRDVASKRLLSRIAWRRKRRRHVQAVLDAIAADIRARAPDHVAITGDVINFSTPEEFEAARGWLAGLGDPADVTISPGNHDALTARGAPEAFAPWRPWLGDDPAAGFPHLRVRGPVALVNLSSAVPTALHLAQGKLGAPQIEAARALLKDAGGRGLYRVVLVHHPVAPRVVAGRKELVDAEALRAVLAETGAELVLHGHAHQALLTSVRGPAGPIPVLAVPAASTPAGGHGEPARWNEIAILRDGAAFLTQVTARGVTKQLTLETLGRFTLA